MFVSRLYKFLSTGLRDLCHFAIARLFALTNCRISLGILTQCLTFFVVIGDADQAALWVVIVKSLVASPISWSVCRLILSCRLFRTFSWNNPQSVLFLYNNPQSVLLYNNPQSVLLLYYDPQSVLLYNDPQSVLLLYNDPSLCCCCTMIPSLCCCCTIIPSLCCCCTMMVLGFYKSL